MVCPRCKSVVKGIMEKLGIPINGLRLGEVEVENMESIDLVRLKELLEKEGFELIFDREGQIAELIKSFVLQYLDNIMFISVKLSDYLSGNTGLNYSYLSCVFSEIENITIEKHFILVKIEKVKELLTYKELTLSQIADRLAYSSVHALSAQFKKITGLTVSEYKRTLDKNRKSLDDLH